MQPILHVHVVDDTTGALLADVDAQSTADGLAYFVQSRRIEPEATAATVAPAGGVSRKEAFVREWRNPISNAVERALTVHVEGDAEWCPRCQEVLQRA